MSATANLRRGWCPGALRPMPVGDGLLARIRVSGGRLSLDQADAIAEGAARFGNGVIEISSRANIQLRGIREACLAALQSHLEEFGLIDADEATESLRNIVASPIADIDVSALLDPAPLVAALEALLAGDRTLLRLPPKFSFIIDAGGVLPLGDVEADVRFAAIETASGAACEVSLPGDETIAARVAPNQLGAAARDLAHAYLCQAALAGPEARRMRHLTSRIGVAAIFARAGLKAEPSVATRRRVAPRDWLGVRSLGAAFCVVAAPSLGRVKAREFALLVRESRRRGARDIRLTPWRSAIVTGLSADTAATLSALLDRAGFIVDPANPLLAIVACAGAPACANAERDVQADALAVASEVSPSHGIMLHLSGCAKGCARSAPSPFTLVARDGAYDLVLGGRAGDTPSRRGLSIEDAATALVRDQGEPPA